MAVTPFEILRHTPQTNCGRCGHPTCLAFAAAVARTGEDIRRCPDADLRGLELGEPSQSLPVDPALEHDLALVEHLKSKIAALDFSAIAGPLGAALASGRPDTLVLRYLGQQVQVSRSGILINGTPPADPRDQILLYNYIHSGGSSEPRRNWVGMESLPNSISKVKTLVTYCQKPLARLFSACSPEALLAAVRQLDGEPAPQISATSGFVIPVLPRVPQLVLFWAAEPEDGFEATVKVLFDARVMDFLDLESLVFTAERLAERLKGLIEAAP